MTARDVMAKSILDAGRNMGALAHHSAKTFEGKIVEFQLHDLKAAGYSIIHESEIHGARKFEKGERVTKISGSSWTGRVVGFYSTKLTPIGYCVESENEPGSVQIYPEAAIRALPDGGVAVDIGHD